ncbi:hypothetical protein THASP1DRAFT_30886 [Thamnocephalis sphaerospora]|uniref:Mitochondrial ribosomal protein L27-domain-containing protein n=1 Tax=Thamnocephalis sphaerospora TaxID=78915 RepID=A0A4P9XPW0_9FUNG|nr:hypothetical protein THASP1DRAFT_30886 [Thamnocephalis sphaerospora]|eukprot:RKP07300.1 hypothetical protein THASP1DRAFT_30886 [Thamnocephalis sphaerospora]
MFRPTRVLLGAFRTPMNTKRGHNYYKGAQRYSDGRDGTPCKERQVNANGAIWSVTATVGDAASWERQPPYIIDYAKVRTYVVPDMADCELKPYVSHRTEKIVAKITPEDFAGIEEYKTQS